MGVPRAITVLRDRFGAPRGQLRDLISKVGVSRKSHLSPWTTQSWRLSESQLAMVDVIEDEALKAGLTPAAAAAMVANSWAESGLNPSIVQKGVAEPGVGLFQLTGSPAKNPAKGSYEQRKDPAFNTRYMLSEMRGGFGVAFKKAMSEGAGVDSLASIFARDMERCKYCSIAWASGKRLKYTDQGSSELVGPSGRAALARLLFPTMTHTGDINPQVEAKPHHGGAWSTSKPPEITYTPAPVPERKPYGTPAPLPPVLTSQAPSVSTAPATVDTVLVAPLPVPLPSSEPAPEESSIATSVTTVARSLSLTPQQLLGIGVASAVVATFAGVLIVRSRRLEAARPLSYSGAR